VVFFFSFIVKVPIRPACAGAFKIAWISTYPTVQIRRTTSVYPNSAGMVSLG
jgi:hypothetical protein